MAGVGAQEVGEGGGHAQDQDGQAGHGGGDAHGARRAWAWARRWQVICPAMPSSSDPIAEARANRRVRADAVVLADSQARSA